MRRKRQAQKPLDELSDNEEGDSPDKSPQPGTTDFNYSEGKMEMSPPRTTPVLKISFGHGSVMKIKAKLNGPSDEVFQ
jgi:hypothetical protein